MFNKINISPQKQTLIVYIVLTMITLVVFWQASQYDFVNLDDDKYVTANRHVQSGLSLNGIRWAFSTTYAQYWHPLTWLSLMLDYELFGLNAGGYHVINLLVHILSTLLLFWLLNRMTGDIWKSAFVAAFFAIHPLRVESVAWIAKRRDILCVFFWMTTLCFYVYYTEKQTLKRYFLVIFSFIFALLNKPMVVTLPLVMILLDYWPLRRFEQKAGKRVTWQLKEKIPFFLLTAVFSIVTIYARDFSSMAKYPLDARLANALVSFMIYLEKFFWPYDLTVLQLFPSSIPIWKVAISTLLIMVISLAIIGTFKRLPYLFVGWSWYTVTIAPTLGIVQFGGLAMSDHHTYLPSIGIAIMLAWGLPLLFPVRKLRKKILLPAGITFLVILSILTWRQCGYWENGIALYTHALQITKNSFLINNRGNIFNEKGQYLLAINDYNEAIRLSPNGALPYYNRGIAYFNLGRYQQALTDYHEALRLKPDYVDAFTNRGIAYMHVGQYRQAIEDYDEAIRLKPDNTAAHYNRGNAHYQLGQYQQAAEDYSKSIRSSPDYLLAYVNRGNAYTVLGQYPQAIEDYSQAIHLKPNNAAAYENRAAIYLLQGNRERGCLDTQKACTLGKCKLLEFARSKGDCR